MYHDTIQINFRSVPTKYVHDIDFDYFFLISKTPQNNFSTINYSELLIKFSEIGFDIKYIKFNDIEEDETVYCSYNYQSNFNVFFSAYNKILKNKKFNLSFEYGNIIEGTFLRNNMNFFSGIYFRNTDLIMGEYIYDNIISGKMFFKSSEFYQIIDISGIVISLAVASAEHDFKHDFFERYEVKLAQRKYKLNKLKKLFQE